MSKSSVDFETAIDLIMQVKKFCEAGSFNLTKIVSNKMKLMQAIPQKKCLAEEIGKF